MQVKYDELNVIIQQRKNERSVSTFMHQLADSVRSVVGLGGELVDLQVLSGLRGVVRPGAMTLILGAPGSGKSPYAK